LRFRGAGLHPVRAAMFYWIVPVPVVQVNSGLPLHFQRPRRRRRRSRERSSSTEGHLRARRTRAAQESSAEGITIRPVQPEIVPDPHLTLRPVDVQANDAMIEAVADAVAADVPSVSDVPPATLTQSPDFIPHRQRITGKQFLPMGGLEASNFAFESSKV